jgi:translation initiation factor 2B subunit (eIF-2B alpha/beta/delta family)
MKEKLPYIISDKFRQLANALRIAIPDLQSSLPNSQNFGPSQIIDQVQNKNKADEEKRREHYRQQT